jgi:hypothetical protein
MRIAFGAWQPDRPKIGRDGLREAKNVVPAEASYEPWRSPTTTTSAIGARPYGMAGARDATGAVHIFAGTATKLYEINTDGTWTDRSGSQTFTLTDTDRWRFCTFKDRLLATSLTDAIQTRTLSTVSNFAVLGGSPPKAKFIAPYGEFVILAYLEDSTFKVRWCAISDPEEWTIGTGQADEQELPDGGAITGLLVTDVVWIFQEYAIRRMVYVDDPEIMKIEVVERGRGCVAPESLISLGSNAFFLSEDGFYQFDAVTGQSAPIGYERVDEWFKEHSARAYYYRMSGGIDPTHKLAMWLYASTDSATGSPDKALLYNWSVGRWAYADLALELLSPVLTLSVSLDDLDAIYGNLDAIPISLDDPSLVGGIVSMGGITSSGALVRFAENGPSSEALLVADDIAPGPVVMVRGVRPLVDGAGAAVSVNVRHRTQDAFTTSTETTTTRTGMCPQKAIGRFIRVRVRIPAGLEWTDAEGFEIDMTPVENT